MAVIDASVYIALINAQEAEHAASWAWLEDARAAGEPLVAPVILLAEVAAALSRGIGDPQLALQVVRQLEQSGVIDLAPVTLPLASRAAEIAASQRLRGCDAVYVALAEQTNDRLVTLDQQQLQRAAAIVDTRRP
ncbi:MAG: type II toxin-antitoxin system VapC family toxin [Anaerolineales bacterium]|nr:type II toxin-antitoxin system VapC family toxin [Anaerolineales bacterium]